MKSHGKKVIIWGAAGHARVVADIIRVAGIYQLHGFVDEVDPHFRQFLGLPVWGGRECLESLKDAGVSHVIMGFGNCRARLMLAQFVRARGFSLATAIHPSAVVASDAVIGEGSVVAAGAVVNPGASIGENVIVNTKASVDHDCIIHDGAHVCPGATLGGYVTVGRESWVGIGSTVKDHLTIGERAMVGAGSVVVTDIPDDMLVYGVPAKLIRRIEADER